MTQSSEAKEALKELQKHLEQERASGEPLDTSWTDDLPSDPLPTEGDETSVTFVRKPKK